MLYYKKTGKYFVFPLSIVFKFLDTAIKKEKRIGK
jgi:hypothetical protein